MLLKPYNHKHTREYCPYCKSDDHILKDEHHQEVYCTRCGYIIRDTTIFTVPMAIREAQYKESYIRSLWHKKKKKK